MKVMLIDPWGINNTAEYLNGLIYGLSDKVDLTVFTNIHFKQYVFSTAAVNKVFFKHSEVMHQGYLRTAVRGLEYLNGYSKIIRALKKEQFDVVHINWLLNYVLDIRFLKEIKKYCNHVVYTAHNVLPHVNGEAAIDQLRIIYSLTDTIIVHGQSIREELINTYPETKNKIYVQKHGCVLKEPEKGSFDVLSNADKKKIHGYNKIFLSCGAVFYNKGIDRLATVWLENYANADALLVLGGREMDNYTEYDRLKEKLLQAPNVVLFDGFIDNDIMNELFNRCSAIILPYRHASMSGIVFSAAQYSKPIICTNVGSLTEYLKPNEDSIVCDNTNDAINRAIGQAITIPNEQLKVMGEKLHSNIMNDCDWKKICIGIIENAYSN